MTCWKSPHLVDASLSWRVSGRRQRSSRAHSSCVPFGPYETSLAALVVSGAVVVVVVAS